MKKLVYCLLFSILLAYAVRMLLYAGIRRNTFGEYAKLNTLFLSRNNFNTVYAGSSRCETHFNPLLIDPITHTNSYNIGLEGATMPVIYDCISAYLENSTAPENLILNIDFFYQVGTKEEEMIFRFPRYFPYLSNTTLYQHFSGRDSRFPFFKWIPFYSMPYFNENYLDHSLNGYFKFRQDSLSYVKGYLSLGAPAEDIDKINYPDKIIIPEPEIYKSLESIIGLCKQKNINLIFVFSPVYYRDFNSIKNKYQLLREFKKIALKNAIPGIDYSNVPMCYDKQFFKDSRHLNEKGSAAFSVMVAKDLCKYVRPD